VEKNVNCNQVDDPRVEDSIPNITSNGNVDQIKEQVDATIPEIANIMCMILEMVALASTIDWLPNPIPDVIIQLATNNK
jgi:hypothetical protein